MAFSPKRTPSPSGQTFCSYTPERFYSAQEFSDQSEFYAHVRDAILTGEHHEEVIYNQVPTDWAEVVFTRIDEETEHISARKNYNSVTRTLWIRKMPTKIHDCHQGWVVESIGKAIMAGLLIEPELEMLHTAVGTTTEFLQGPYLHSRKEPDLIMQRDDQSLPVFVIESGWSESLNRLRDDMNLWLVGGCGDVKATLILKWERIGGTNRVNGSAEYYTLDPNGMPILRQEEVIFPPPPPPQAQVQAIYLKRRTIFGRAMLPGRNPNDVLTLSFDNLRRRATNRLAVMGLVPA